MASNSDTGKTINKFFKSKRKTPPSTGEDSQEKPRHTKKLTKTDKVAMADIRKNMSEAFKRIVKTVIQVV
jgi:PAB1-binding protein PBP1